MDMFSVATVDSVSFSNVAIDVFVIFEESCSSFGFELSAAIITINCSVPRIIKNHTYHRAYHGFLRLGCIEEERIGVAFDTVTLCDVGCLFNDSYILHLQFEQNLELSGIDLPQFGQNILSLLKQKRRATGVVRQKTHSS